MLLHPEVRRELVAARIQDLEREQARRRPRVAAGSPERADLTAIALRLCRVGDDEALARLAALEEKPLPHGRFVIAEVDGQVVAALPLDGGLPLRDPFVRTAHLLRLLELRAAQLRCQERTRRSLWPWSFGLLRNSI
jgi:hypothetical protein